MAFDSFQTQTFKKVLFYRDIVNLGFPGGSSGKEFACQFRRLKEMWVQSLGWEDPLEEGMETDSSILAWRSPWTEKPGRLQSIGSHRVGHDWSNLACMHSHGRFIKLYWFLLYSKMIQFSQTHTYIHILFHILFHYSLLQNIEYSSLCYIALYCPAQVEWEMLREVYS